MVKNDVWPDKYTYTFVLKACTLLLDIEKGVWIHEQILERGLECDVFIGAGLVDLYCKCGRLGNARKVFDKMWDKDVAVWNAMVAGLAQSLEYGEAVEVFHQTIRLFLTNPPCKHSVLTLVQYCVFLSLKQTPFCPR